MRQESLGSFPTPEENTSLDLEGDKLHFSDGMDPVSVPEKITKDDFLALFGGKLPEQISPDVFNDGGELTLEQG